MSLKVRLTVMMVALLVAVVGLQYVLMEHERRELQRTLSQLSGEVNRSTAVFMQRSHNLTLRPGGPPALADVLREIGADSLSWRGTSEGTMRVLIFADSTRRIPREAHAAYVQMEETVRLDSTGRMIHRRITQGPTGTLEPDTCAPKAYVLRDTFQRFVTAGGPPASSDERDFVVNLPIPSPGNDSLFGVQLRYSYASLEDEFAASRQRGLMWIIGILGGGVLVAAGLAMQFTRPIQALRGSFRRVEGGDLEVHVPVERRDEIGALSSSFNDMVDRLRESKQMETRLGEAERLAAIGRLAAGVAHEVRNPLNTILLTMQHLRDKVIANGEQASATTTPGAAGADQARSDFDRYHAIVTGEIVRLEKLVSSFLDLARSGEMRLERHDLARSVRDAVDLYAPLARDRGITLEADVAPNLRLDADPSRLPMVWSNLIANAIEATPRGGSVQVTARRESDAIIVTIADTGRGIAPEQRERVWEPFVSGREDGTGLGLAIVRTVVEGHGGTVTAEFPASGGTCMRVQLPAASIADRRPAPEPGQPL